MRSCMAGSRWVGWFIGLASAPVRLGPARRLNLRENPDDTGDGWPGAPRWRPWVKPRATASDNGGMTALASSPLPVRTAPRGWRALRSGLARHRFALDVVLGATLMVVVHLFVLQISIVKGHSMEPSLQDGDRLVVDRVTCNFGDVHRGDVVVLRYPRNPSVDFVKRIVGLPGDRVALRKGQLWVNGEMVAVDWTCIDDKDTTEDVFVPPGSYF